MPLVTADTCTAPEASSDHCRTFTDKCQKEKQDLQTRLDHCTNDLAQAKNNEDQGSSESTDQLLLKEELKLAQSEVDVLNQRLSLCETSLKSESSKDSACHQDLQLANAELSAAKNRVTAAEQALKENDCSATKRKLRAQQEVLDELEISNKSLKKQVDKLQTELAQATSVTDVKAQLETVEKQKEKAEAALYKAQLEAKTAKDLLEKLTASLESREKYEALVHQHQSEVLPFWLSQQVSHGFAAASAVYHTTSKSLQYTASATLSKVSVVTRPVTKSVASTAQKLWKLRVKPALTAVDEAIEHGLGASWNRAKLSAVETGKFAVLEAHVLSKALVARAIKTRQSAEAALLKQMQKIDALRPLAQPTYVHYGIIAILSAIFVPLTLAVVHRTVRFVVYNARRGTAMIVPPATGSQFNTVEDKLGYRFSDNANFKAALAESAMLTWLGRNILSLLSAERQWRSAVEKSSSLKDTKPLDDAVNAVFNTQVISAAADKSGVADFVYPGAGAKSKVVAANRAREMFIATLAAVYVDSEFDIKAVRKVFARNVADDIASS